VSIYQKDIDKKYPPKKKYLNGNQPAKGHYTKNERA